MIKFTAINRWQFQH